MPTPRKETPRKPDQPKTRPGINPDDPVDQASDDSFPASDPPSFSGTRAQPRMDPTSAPQDSEEQKDRMNQQRTERDRMDREKDRKH